MEWNVGSKFKVIEFELNNALKPKIEEAKLTIKMCFVSNSLYMQFFNSENTKEFKRKMLIFNFSKFFPFHLHFWHTNTHTLFI